MKFKVLNGFLILMTTLNFVSTGLAESKGIPAIIFGKKEITLKSKAQGEVMKVKVEEGEPVKAGQVIAVIDDRQQRIERDLASVEYKTADQDYIKTKKLNKYVSKDEILQKEAAYMKKKSTFELKELDLSNTRIVSPIEGFITKNYFVEGERVSVGEKAFDVVQLQELVMVANVPAAEISKVKKGKEIDFTVADLKEMKFKGNVIFVSPVIDSASETIRVKIAVKNIMKPNEKTYFLKPGMIASLALEAEVSKQLHNEKTEGLAENNESK